MPTVAQILRAEKRAHKQARARRALAYNRDYAMHGEAEPVPTSPGWWRFFPHPSHRGWLVEEAALIIGGPHVARDSPHTRPGTRPGRTRRLDT